MSELFSLCTRQVKRTRRHSTHRVIIALALGITVCGLHAFAEEPAPRVLTTAKQVHDLAAAQAAKQLPVHLVATVTRYNASTHFLFVQDVSGAVFVYTSKQYPITDGDLVEITGVTDSSFRTVVKTDPQIRILGHGSLPKPVQLGTTSYPGLMSGKWDCLRVTMPGRVRSALINPKELGRLEMEILTSGGVVNAYIDHPEGLAAASLIDSDVLMTGETGATFNSKWQAMGPILFGANAADMKVLRAPGKAVADLPLTRIDNIMQAESVVDVSQRVKVRGVVTAYHPGTSVVIRQDERSLTASTRQRMELPLGSIVDLSGFAMEGEYGPAMKQVTILPTGNTNDVKPYRANYAKAISGVYNDELVSIQGKVLSQTRTDSLDQVTLLMDHHAVTMNLEHLGNAKRLPEIPIGTDIQVVGICHVTLTEGWGNVGSTPMFFSVDMRSASDVIIVRAAPWWTIDHLLELLAAVCLIFLVICLWALMLRRRVTQQTTEIERSMWLERERGRLLEAISSATPLPELIADLCRTCEAILPGVRSVCSVQGDVEIGTDARSDDQISPASHFAQDLHDSSGSVLGQFQAFREEGHAFSRQEVDVLEVFAGLAALAINQRHMYQELNYTSTHDQLTALPNRRMADACLERALAQGEPGEVIVAVAYIDVNDFKQVNDQHGHKTGDLYLQHIAARLKKAVRNTDVLARIGGDEFLLVAVGLNTVAQAEICRDRLNACFDEPFTLDGHVVNGSASVGLAVSPGHGTQAEDLKRQADLDMYTVKYKRRAPVRTTAPSLYTAADLEAALAKNQFVLYYQPLFCPNGRLCGLEALLRLNDPVLGIVGPDAFIDVAEENNVIVPLGAWVLRQAVSAAVQWNLQAAGARIMVNVSMRQVEHPGFALEVLQILRSAGLPAHCLELEITERLLMQNPPQVMRQLNLLRDNGVQVAIDDFGVQNSSLSALRSLPFDTLKLDRTFINALDEDDRALHIVGAIVSLAQTLGKRIVAEGVETEQQIGALSVFEDVDLQGYYFSRPRPTHEITASLETWIAGRKLPKKMVSAPMLPQMAFSS